MFDDTSRRAFLATLGAAAVGGCVSSGDDAGADGTPSTTQTPTATPETTEPTPTDAPTTDTGTESQTESPTEGQSNSTPEPPASLDTAWPMPAADAGRSNATDAVGPTELVARLWEVERDTSLSTPVVADGTLYVGGEDGTVRAHDARTGDREWQWSGAAAAGTPSVVADGTLYVGGEDGTVRAHDARTGDREWQWSDGAAAGTPSVVGDRLFVPTADAVVALDAANGREAWRVETPERAAVLAADHGVYWLDESGPVVVALAREDGSERWRTSIATPWEPPLFAGDEQVFVSSGTHDNRFWRLSVEDGEILNEAPRSGADFPAEQCYADGTVYAVDPFFGNVRTTPVDGGDGWSAGVPPGGADPGGTVSVGPDRVYYVSTMSEKPALTALSKSDGSESWTADVAGTVAGRPVVASAAVFVPTDGGLHAFDSAKGDELWMHAGIGSQFVVVDDVVYATNDGGIEAYRAAPAE